MNITFFTPTLKLSGGNIVMFKYAQSLVEFGHNVTIIAPHSEIIDKFENGVHIKTFKKFPNKYFEHIFFQLIYLNKFFDLTPESDIIIPIFFPLAIHAIYCKKKGKTKKIISLFQDSKEMYWYGNYIFSLLRFKCITEQIDKFIAVSNPISEQIKTCANNDIVVIPNGIEHEYFYPRNCEKENYILFVGSSSKNKGVKYFLEAFELVKKDFPELKAKIVSPNNEKFENSDIEVINVGKNRTLLGEIYSKALVYVSQSFGDSFGLPPLEAMACSTAVVLTDTIGAKEYAEDGENCFVVPVKNTIKTQNAIIKLISDCTKRKSIEKKAFDTAKKYIWEQSYKSFNQEITDIDND